MKIIRTQKNISRMEVDRTPKLDPDPYESLILSLSRLEICQHEKYRSTVQLAKLALSM
jgi:hypothetical protein